MQPSSSNKPSLQVFKDQLGIGHVSRESQQFPLYPFHEWIQFQNNNLAEKYKMVYNVEGPQTNLNYYLCKRNICVVYKDAVFDAIDLRFPGIRAFLFKHKGKIVLAGGIFSNKDKSTDVDIFFHNCTQEEAEYILDDAKTFFPYYYSSHELVTNNDSEKGAMLSKEYKLYHTRTEQTTDIWILKRNMYYDPVKIQFIHRIYPSAGHVIGGFDVQASMVLTDGEEIYSTANGAWCMVNQCIVVDISRRSPSFGFRLMKYNLRGFKLVFVGLDLDKLETKLKPVNVTKHTAKNAIKAILEEYNLKFSYYESDYDDRYGINTSDIPDTKYLGGDSIQIMADLRLEKNNLGHATHEINRGEMGDYEFGGGFAWFEHCNPDHKSDINLPALSTGNIKAYATDFIELTLGNNYTDKNPVFCDDITIEDIDRHLTRMEVWIWFRDYLKYFANPHDEIPVNFLDDGTYESRHKMAIYRQDNKHIFTSLIFANMEKYKKACKDNLMKVTWMVQNPQRQWSSTIHPEPLSPKDYYLDMYNGFTIFDSEVVRLLMLARKDPTNVWSNVDQNVLKIIIYWIPFV